MMYAVNVDGRELVVDAESNAKVLEMIRDSYPGWLDISMHPILEGDTVEGAQAHLRDQRGDPRKIDTDRCLKEMEFALDDLRAYLKHMEPIVERGLEESYTRDAIAVDLEGIKECYANIKLAHWRMCNIRTIENVRGKW